MSHARHLRPTMDAGGFATCSVLAALGLLLALILLRARPAAEAQGPGQAAPLPVSSSRESIDDQPALPTGEVWADSTCAP